MRRSLAALVGFSLTFFGQALRAADPVIPADLAIVEERVNRTATPDARRWVAEQVRLLKPGQQPNWIALEAAARSRAIRLGEASMQDPNAGLGDLFAFMIAYQRLLNKEAREDQKQARASKQLELQTKEGKLSLEKQKIGEQISVASAQTLERARAIARRLATVVTPVPTRLLTRMTR